jgi:hypothetical protein
MSKTYNHMRENKNIPEDEVGFGKAQKFRHRTDRRAEDWKNSWQKEMNEDSDSSED